MGFRVTYLLLMASAMGGCPDERRTSVQETPTIEAPAKPASQVEESDDAAIAIAIAIADDAAEGVQEQHPAPAPEEQGSWKDSRARAELYEAEAESCSEKDDWKCSLSKLDAAFELRAKLALEPFEKCDTARYPSCLSEIQAEVETLRKGLPTGNLANCITFPAACSQYSSEQLVALSSLSALANRRSYYLDDLKLHAESLSQSALHTPRLKSPTALSEALAAWKLWSQVSGQRPPKALLRRLRKMLRSELGR